MYETIKKYINTFSVTGREYYLANVIEADLKPFATEIRRDAMGNLIVFKKGADSSKKLMIAAHMDEIGFMVTNITDNGYIRVTNVGGISALFSSYGLVKFENGLKGVIVADSSAKDIKVKDLVIDIGAKNKKDAARKVAVGDLCALVPSFTRLMNKRISAKAFDDRLGCAVAAVSAMKSTPKYDTYYVFTVQEEVGCRGAMPATFDIRPDYAIAIDVTGTGDTVGARAMEIKLGNGAAVKLKDSSVICSQLMVDAMTECAKRNGIKYQLEVLEAGGTDTHSMQLAAGGCHAGCISIPTRYIHSPVETVDLGDVEACESLLTALVNEGVE
ncbi:MAG: M20/M25/M40 family metallo-hydrolase [Clostridia bacterium]|nr:M20/M25/M40 family metallo-hydrolase [Clostridia bacterium]